MDIPIQKLELFLLVLVRVASMVALMPLFGYPGVPRPAKIGLGIFLSLLIFPFVHQENVDMPSEVFLFLLLVGKEAVVGLVVGFATTFLFMGVQLSGHLVGLQMGLGIANVIDPQSDTQVSIIGQFEFVITLLIFLMMDGHHFLIRALKTSFEVIPLAEGSPRSAVAREMVRITGWMFVIAFKIGAPMLAALFLTKIALGIVARTMPQMNVFLVGMPLNLGVGFLSLALSLSLLVYVFKGLLQRFQEDILLLLRLFG